MKKQYIFFLTTLIFIGCSPLTKESYLSQYNRFISRIKENHNNHNFDWEKSDELLQKFSQTYYNRFKDKLTFQEKASCKKLESEYYLIKLAKKAGKIKTEAQKDFNALQEQVQNYLKNDLPGDVDLLTKEAQEAIEKIRQTFE